MRPSRFAGLAVLATAGALTATFALSSSAVAVAPATATATYNCGSWGTGLGTLTATDSGGVKKIKLTSTAITMPIGSSADPNSITTTLKTKKNDGTEVDFSGKVNPAMTGPNPITLGAVPLSSGSLATGNTTNSWLLTGTPSATNWSLRIVTSSPTVATVYCIATTNQSSAFTW
ncbi:hypothetical protein AB0P12_15205 [Streptomyces subrutilus]|uniref:Uncharacterized protein n=1 Tax=Streptomyces subrutilus TaxID=36818 RepID=A0A5P2UKG3_9ACTN|nr:hypothetical protein [Streptomyces subrutilus]QEU77087.1 hypothetical protein CP968_01075 [Streptomyces subrutilus]WSJ33953.1 hypothetical protein OG479_34185 [Streptomyces subrutilus]GGZ86456.1 hypothetical protein GCM10010371_53010 [Streptomyces subrutilus]